MFCHCCIRSPSPCISRIIPHLTLLGFGHLAKMSTLSVQLNIRFLAVARFYRHGRSPSISTTKTCHTYTCTHTNVIPRCPTFAHLSCSSLGLFYIYSTFYCTIIILLSIPWSSNTGPSAAWLLSTIELCTSFDIDRALVCQQVGSFLRCLGQAEGWIRTVIVVPKPWIEISGHVLAHKADRIPRTSF